MDEEVHLSGYINIGSLIMKKEWPWNFVWRVGPCTCSETVQSLCRDTAFAAFYSCDLETNIIFLIEYIY